MQILTNSKTNNDKNEASNLQLTIIRSVFLRLLKH